MNRRNQILVAVLAVQMVVLAVVFWPRRSASEAKGQPLFAGVTADQVVKVTIGDGEGQSIHLAKKDGAWVLPDAGDYPAKEDAVAELITKTLGITTGDAVVTTASGYKRLKVAADDYERLVELDLADGAHHRLYIGTAPTYSAAHVRADDQEAVYLASSLAAQDASAAASAWVDTAYLSITADEIVAMTLENAFGTYQFEKSGGAWTMAGLEAGETLNESAVKAIANRVSPLSLSRPLGKEAKAEYGLDRPLAVLTVKTSSTAGGDKTYTITVGAQDAADSTYVVKSSESPYYVRVSSYSVQDMVNKDREGFLQVPATPTP